MTKKLFSILLLLCSVFNSFSEETDFSEGMDWDPNTFPEKRDWDPNIDEAILRSTLDFIEKNDFTDNSIRKYNYAIRNITSARNNDTPIQFGFRLQKYCKTYSGSYLTIRSYYTVFKEQYEKKIWRGSTSSTQIAFQEQPIKFIISIQGYDRIKDNIKADLRERYSKIISSNNEYRYENATNYEKYKSYKKELVGECEAMVVSQGYKNYYDCLYSADTTITYISSRSSRYCKAKPKGRNAMEKLLKLNDMNVFISLLKGDNPAGRIYAAEGILRLENSMENVDMINSIFSSLVKDEIQYSYSAGDMSGASYYQFFEYDRNRKFPEIDDKE
ncbi:MAG: hypothetical protein K6F48_06645 [Paludibacteraceae bacterium]|nr:hypothetical protein [Paludibacteraceae bacterium]